MITPVFILAAFFCACALLRYSVIIVPQGNAGMVSVFGELQEKTLPPGLNIVNPVTSKVSLENVLANADEVKLECKSKDFQVVKITGRVNNQLPPLYAYTVLKNFQNPTSNVKYDDRLIVQPAENFIMELCSQYTGEELRSSKYKDLNEILFHFLESHQKNRPELNGQDTGIIILSVFFEVPLLSDKVEAHYQEIATQHTAYKAEEARQLTAIKQKETATTLAVMEKDGERRISVIRNEELIASKRAESEMSKIAADAEADKLRIESDANSYAAFKKADANKALLTTEYMHKLAIEAIGCQNTMWYGKDLPSILQTGMVPSVLTTAADSETQHG